MKIDTDTRIRLERLVDIVKSYLQTKNLEVPFFVAGGSVFSNIVMSSYSDINVYFYDFETANRVFDDVKTINKTIATFDNFPTIAEVDVEIEHKTQLLSVIQVRKSNL